MPPPSITELTDDVIAGRYDAGSLARGRRYAAEDRVEIVRSTGSGLTGAVEGSARNVYLARVGWAERSGRISIDDDCSCPLGGACKHVVATILVARQAATPDPEEPTTTQESMWRQELSEVVGVASAPTAGRVDPDAVPLALQIVVERPAPSRYEPDPSPRLTALPLRQGQRGGWVRTGVNWRDLSSPYTYAGYNLHPDHIQALRALLDVLKQDRYYYPDSKPIELGTIGPELWFLLDRVQAAGVDLVGADGSSESVSLVATEATASVDLSAEADGGVELTVVADLDGSILTLDPKRSDVIGSPAHGLYIETDDGLQLIRLVAPLDESLGHRLGGPPLIVPAAEVDELLNVYEPLLARSIPVHSTDGSVTIAPIEFVGLVLTIERDTIETASLRWSVRYRRGDAQTDYPLRQLGGALRDRSAEQKALAELELPGDLLNQFRDPDGVPLDLDLNGTPALIALTGVVPELAALGQVVVEYTGEAPELREASGDPHIFLSIDDAAFGTDAPRGLGDPTDWFDLHVEVTVDGETVPFAALFTALATGEPLLALASGTWLRLDRPEFDRLRELIEEARALADVDGDAAARVNRFQAGWWDDLLALGVIDAQTRNWAARMEAMRDLTAPERVEPPDTLHATLRHYQQDGLDWLAFLHRSGLGGILADDMGLGKTVQTIALCLHVLEKDPDARFLVVAPTSVVPNWHHEAAQFAPGLEVCTIHGSQARRREPLAETIGDARIVVTSYALFRIEYEAYASIPWNILLLDEAQFVKNHQGKTYQCARRLEAGTKIAITGTPLENSLMDLWSLLSIVAPGLYPDPKRFSEVYRKPIESGQAPELLAQLRRRIAPLMRRRTKDEVLTELPPKTEQTIEIELSPRHRRLYEQQLQQQRKKVLGLVDDMRKNRFEIFKSLTILRQLSLDPVLVDPEQDGVGSAKLDRLVEDLTQIVAEGHRALVFSQFTRFLALARTRLDAAGIPHSYLDGSTRDRAAAIETFTSGQVPVFVISLKAGGFGLNLTQADYCFVLDPWWNPAVETQAVDRAHRIGQTNPVMVYRYVAEGTIEEKVMELKAKKAALFTDVLDADGALGGALSEADIRGLLDPL